MEYEPLRRVIIRLPESQYQRLLEVAEREVREPDQQIAYFVKQALERFNAGDKAAEIPAEMTPLCSDCCSRQADSATTCIP